MTLILKSESVFWGNLGLNFGAFQNWKQRVIFGSGNRRASGNPGIVVTEDHNAGGQPSRWV